MQREIGGRAGWQFNPNLQLYADVVLNNRTHEAAAATDGILRNSEGYRAQVGVAFDKRGKLQGEASAGYASQTPDDGRLKTVTGFIYNGKLSWQPTGLTEVIATATSDIGETTLAGSGGALTRTTGVEVRHALRRHIILVAGRIVCRRQLRRLVPAGNQHRRAAWPRILPDAGSGLAGGLPAHQLRNERYVEGLRGQYRSRRRAGQAVATKLRWAG